VAYISPSWSGFSVIGAYVADAADNSGLPSDNDNQAFSGSATYSNGPLYAALGYEWHDDDIGGDKMFRGGASYKFGAFKLGGMVEKGKAGNNDDFGAGFQSIDRWGGNAFGTYDFGNNTVKLQFSYVGDSDYVKDLENLNSDSDKTFMWSLGLDHKFSKRTKVYGAVGQLVQGDGMGYILGGGHNTNTFNTRQPGKNQNAVSIGMVHTF
jgi:predicted porin